MQKEHLKFLIDVYHLLSGRAPDMDLVDWEVAYRVMAVHHHEPWLYSLFVPTFLVGLKFIQIDHVKLVSVALRKQNEHVVRLSDERLANCHDLLIWGHLNPVHPLFVERRNDAYEVFDTREADVRPAEGEG